MRAALFACARAAQRREIVGARAAASCGQIVRALRERAVNRRRPPKNRHLREHRIRARACHRRELGPRRDGRERRGLERRIRSRRVGREPSEAETSCSCSTPASRAAALAATMRGKCRRSSAGRAASAGESARA
jgi:hypothetical protein